MIVEAANVPTSPEAERLLAARGVLVVPDFVANVATNAWWWWTLFGDIAPERDAAFAKIAATQRRLVGALLDRAAADGVLPRAAADGDRRREPRAARGRPRRGRVAVLRRLVAALAVLGASAPAAAATPHELTVGVSGDLLPHLPVVARAVAYGGGRPDFRPMLRRIRPWVRRNDLVALPRRDAARPRRARRLPALQLAARARPRDPLGGFDACSTASNHSVDRGAHGIATTRAALGRQGVRHTGSSATERQRRRLLLLAPAACGSRSSPTRSTRTASRSRTSGRSTSPPPARIVRDARRARRAGAQAVIVNLHWGTEYQHAPDPSSPRSPASWPGRGRSPRWSASTPTSSSRSAGSTGCRSCSGRATCSPTRRPHAARPAPRTGCSCACACAPGPDGARVTEITYVPTWVRHPDYTVVRAAPGSASYRRTVAVAGRGPRLTPAGN